MNMNRVSAALAASALVLGLAACTPAPTNGMGDGMHQQGPGASDVDVNAADRMFVMMMIPHHEQAIDMSNALLAKDGIDQEIRDLAERIKAAQQPEIDLMRGWLDDWGMGSDMSGSPMQHGDGMMSGDDMAALEAAEGADAARLFLEQMIEHHEGAIDMAEAELDDGDDPDVRTLAEDIIASQTEEIALMRDLLARL